MCGGGVTQSDESAGSGGVSVRVLQVRLEIGSDPTEVGRARRWARDRLAGCGVAADDEQLAETVVLLVSELVTNAVVHTGRPAVLSLSLTDGRAAAGGSGGTAGSGGGALRVEVCDGSRTAPVPRHALGEDTGGRGLELVSGLADRWGWQAEGDGKRVWCEFDRVRGATPSDRAGDRADDRAGVRGQPADAPAPPRPRGSLTLRPTF